MQQSETYMADAISPISTSAGRECQTVDVARMSVAGEIEQLFEDGEVQSPMSASGKAGEQLDGPLLSRYRPPDHSLFGVPRGRSADCLTTRAWSLRARAAILGAR